MKSIIFVLDELSPTRGAPQVRINNFLRSFTHWNRTAVGGRLSEENVPKGFRLINRPSETKPFQFLLFLLRLGVFAKKVAREIRPDVMVLSVPKYEMLFFAPALSKLARTFVLDFRDSLGFLDYGAYLSHFLPKTIAQPLGRLIHRVNTWLQKRALNSANIVTVANAGIAQSIDHPNVVVVSNGVDTEEFNPEGKRWYDGSRPLRLAYLGNFAEKDRFDWILELGQISGVELHLIGDGRNKSRICDALRGISFVDHGIVHHSLLPQLLLQMDVGFIFRKTGVDESIPVSLYEFSSMNIPSICNDTGLMADFVREHNLGFVVQNVTQLRSILESLSRVPAQLRRFENLHQLADSNFSLKASREKFLGLFEFDTEVIRLAENS